MLFEQLNVPTFESNPLIIGSINQIEPIIIKQVALMIKIIGKLPKDHLLSCPLLPTHQLKLLTIFKHSGLIEVPCDRRRFYYRGFKFLLEQFGG